MKTYHYCAMRPLEPGIQQYCHGLMDVGDDVIRNNYSDVKTYIGAQFNPPVGPNDFVMLSLTRVD